MLDLSTEIAGPYCTKLLTDAGADVIKIEETGAPDPLRRWTASGAPLDPDEDGALFQHLAASKRAITLDLCNDEGRSTLIALAATADLIVESFGPGGLAARGLSYERLAADNPRLSLVSISPWGLEGPWAERPATEFTLQAATGSTDHRGLPDRFPVGAGGRIGEWIAASFAAVAGLLACMSARRTGRGHHVDLSMFESMVLSMTYYLDLAGQWRGTRLPRGIEVPSIEPAKDGWVGFCTITGQQWKDFCTMIGHPEVGDDERYLDGMQRTKDLAFMQEIIHGWTRQRTVAEIVEQASLFRIPAVPVGNGKTVLEMDQFVEREVFVRGPGGFLRPRPPFLLERTRLRPFGAAPRVGEHDEAVLAALGGAPARASTAAVECGRGDDAARVWSSARPWTHFENDGAKAAGRSDVPAIENAGSDTRRARGTIAEGPVPATDAALPLAGLRVVDLTTFWAGPFATCLLADMGADVIKVESIQRPDGMRFAGAMPTERLWEWSPVFAGVNPGKRDVTLKLDSDEGIALVKRLIEVSDVVIENFSPRVVEQFGLDWPAVHAVNPRAIMVRMPAFGLSGPWRDRPGFAMTVEQVSGLAWVTGYDDMPLVVRGACDPLGGLHAVFALLLALEHRRRTGDGQLVEVALAEVALNAAAEQAIEYSTYGRLIDQRGNRGSYAAPQGVYRCAGEDAWIALAAATDEQWRGLCRVVGASDFHDDPALATAEGRHAAHDEIDRRIEAWTAARDPDEAAARLLDAGVPAQPLVNGHRLMPNPQLEARGFFHEMDHPVTGKTRYPGLPMTFSGLPRALHKAPPPMLGQHNDEVLAGLLGLGADEIGKLREKRIIGERPTFM